MFLLHLSTLAVSVHNQLIICRCALTLFAFGIEGESVYSTATTQPYMYMMADIQKNAYLQLEGNVNVENSRLPFNISSFYVLRKRQKIDVDEFDVEISTLSDVEISTPFRQASKYSYVFQRSCDVESTSKLPAGLVVTRIMILNVQHAEEEPVR